MKTVPHSADTFRSNDNSNFNNEIGSSVKAPPKISDAKLETIFVEVGQKLREGLSKEAEKILRNTIESYTHTSDHLANLQRLLSFTLETLGKYEESLAVLRQFEDKETLETLSKETQIYIATQLAVAYNNLTDQPKAVTLLKEMLEEAKEYDLPQMFGGIFIALARVYRKLNECPIARDYGEKSLRFYREYGEWLGMAQAYREIALSYHQEGNSIKSVEYFQSGIQIIGEHPAPFMLGKLYTDMSGAYWFLRRPKLGIECLEKSIQFFEHTEHILNSVIAYNNLGLNLMLVGEWQRAEEMVKRALELAVSVNHVHVAGILESLGELKILRGELGEAEALLNQAVDMARTGKREWYEVQAMRNLARCCFAQGKVERAIEISSQAIELSGRIGETHYANMAGLVLAESYLAKGEIEKSQERLSIIEENDPSTDFFVLGNIQRIRGLIGLEQGDQQLAVHHFNRSLTIFEAAEDIYHTALAHYLIGSNLPKKQTSRSLRHLTAANSIFSKLGVEYYANITAQIISSVNSDAMHSTEPPAEQRTNSVVSQLLMVRLAEATASRELLFRELVAVLQQESPAVKMIIAEPGQSRHLKAFITHGYTANESSGLIVKLDAAQQKRNEKDFIKKNELALFMLRPKTANPAVLIIHNEQLAVLNDGSSLDPLLRVVELGMDVIELRSRDKNLPVEYDVNPYNSSSLMPGFIHSSPAMTALVDEVYKIRGSDVTVLVTGESGTGKELVSRAIHTISNRKDKVFIPFNCTAIPKELAEGHLFGYRRGAFTGAVIDSPGMIRAAHGGTLFLDEIGDLSLEVQPKLLRFLQEGEVQPIGEKTPVKVDVRVIAATNMPLEDMVADGSFREDLYYRLNVIRLQVPPLRERRAEIPPMINYYINQYSERFGKTDIVFTPQTIDHLMFCKWEGNVRQLCNEIQRVIARAVNNEVITPDHLSPQLKRSSRPLSTSISGETKPIASFESDFGFSKSTEGATLDEAVGDLETLMIKSSLNRHKGNISRVAAELGLTRRGLYLKLARYQIEKSA